MDWTIVIIVFLLMSCLIAVLAGNFLYYKNQCDYLSRKLYDIWYKESYGKFDSERDDNED